MAGAEPLWRFPQRVARSVEQHGLRNAWRRGRRVLATLWREWQLGIQTRGSIAADDLAADDVSFGYQPIPYESCEAVFRRLVVSPQDVFLDYGCGLGRALVVAALHPFRKVVGVERSEELCRLAELNVRRARRQLVCADVTVVHADARHFAVPDEVTTVFLFNPFDEQILRLVLERLHLSLAARPRRITIVYGLPKCRRDLLATLPWLRVVHELATIDADWQRLTIYESVA